MAEILKNPHCLVQLSFDFKVSNDDMQFGFFSYCRHKKEIFGKKKAWVRMGKNMA